MAKKREGSRNAAERLDHHEKILGLIADRLNNDIVPRLDRNEKDIKLIVEGTDTAWSRLWGLLKAGLPW